MSRRSAAQMLFNRIVTTWIIPEIEKRATQNMVKLPVNLTQAFIFWSTPAHLEIWLNEEIDGKGLIVSLFSTEQLQPEQPIYSSMVKGLTELKLPEKMRNHPYLFILQGSQARYYILSQRMHEIVHNEEFRILQKPLAIEGVVLHSNGQLESLYIDTLSDQYRQLTNPISKRKHVLQLTKDLIASTKQTATVRIKRRLKLPSLFVFNDDEFLPLLIETRRTYIDGYFFSCIASAATAADRICIRLTEYYDRWDLRKLILEWTLGKKIQKLRSEGIITKEQEGLLSKLNKIRNKHLHAKQAVSAMTLKKDALSSAKLLHMLVEGTFSVYRDHTFSQGRIVAKRLAQI